MNYPLISEYVAAIKDAAGNLDKLANLKPVLDNDDEPIHSSGAFAVVFKMVDDNGKYYALKCFTEEQTGRAEAYKLIADELEIVNSSYMLNVEYYEKELFVDSNVTEDTEFPVLLMDWVDGETMDKYIADNYADEYEMSWLCYRFCKMAAWLMSQPFAHGDLKPDNIIVREDGELVLIDYDGMFVPAMKGRKSPTLGTKDFVHPNRKVDDFDETIDDFTLASIALSLKAISLDSSLYEKFAKPDRLLFSSTDYLDLSKCEMMKKLCEFMGNLDLVRLKSLFEYSLALGNLSSVSFRSFVLAKPTAAKPCKYTLEELEAMSEVTDEELEEIDWDETVAKYSKDGKRLLKVWEDINGAFSIRKGTLVVCNGAFSWCNGLTEITIPKSVTSIGDGAFFGCSGLTEITIPESV
ncbi:MAG: leucine-rich repeat protein, partial [Paludibacteraceae bacterium]|nr:leucine-rich repeat protein [Paludibacteraceae bacterium]